MYNVSLLLFTVSFAPINMFDFNIRRKDTEPRQGHMIYMKILQKKPRYAMNSSATITSSSSWILQICQFMHGYNHQHQLCHVKPQLSQKPGEGGRSRPIGILQNCKKRARGKTSQLEQIQLYQFDQSRREGPQPYKRDIQ